MEYSFNLWQWLDARGGVDKQRREIVAAVRKQLDKASGCGDEHGGAVGTGLARNRTEPTGR